MDEAVSRQRQSTLDGLRRYLPPGNLDAAVHAAARLDHVLSQVVTGRSGPARAMLAYGGGKDSSYMVAFVRLVQLTMWEQLGRRLQLRMVTNRHAGMPAAVMANIDRTYQALGLYDDPDAELLLVDDGTVSVFDKDLPLPRSVQERNRTDLLMTGHRCYGEGRPTFCNACNLSMVSSFAVGAEHDDGVDVVITGDSPREQGAYMAWVRRLARQLGVDAKSLRDFASFVQTTDAIAERYYADIHGGVIDGGAPLRQLRTPSFFSIYTDTAYESGDHWDLLTQFLGFVFDDLAFSFTESDCANPALMAHLRGLRAERIFGTGYPAGIGEYVEFATGLMRVKKFPPHLVEVMHARYATADGVRAMRRRMDGYALAAFGLTEAQLVCMAYSPFAGGGRHLETFLAAEAPDLTADAQVIHRLLSGAQDGVRPQVATRLTEISGLPLASLQTLYAARLAAASPAAAIHPRTPIGLVLADDPHKGTVLTRYSPTARPAPGPISGR
ncbi:hypothetical protein AB0M47_05005 [Hamadaea sp. NPDC051192]|uniref:hypothetical protein n=1 Tax=Hamadaea sp. NPDC051192 TaxID=3154940 RepID=UPI00344A5DE1